MYHSFDSEIAEKYGVHCAIILNHIWFWVEKNEANGINFFDGTYWTYSSSEAFAKLFPYLTPRQIQYSLQKLRDEGLIISGNYNANTYDRTLWYALTKFGKSILQNCQMDSTNLRNGTDNFVRPIPDIRTDISTDIRTDIKHEEKKGSSVRSKTASEIDSIVAHYCENDQTLIELVNDWLTMRKAKRAPNTERAVQSNLEKLNDYARQSGMTPHQYIDEVIRRGWQAFYVIGGENKRGTRQPNPTPDEYHYGEYL